MGQIDNKKYHITDDGKIFRINPDSTFTELGNIENDYVRQPNQSSIPHLF